MISELVEVAGISESSLLRGFKRITGCGPIAYHAKKRIERAAWLLVNTGMSVTSIAMDMGFDDPNYFSRVFRKVLGMAPRE